MKNMKSTHFAIIVSAVLIVATVGAVVVLGAGRANVIALPRSEDISLIRLEQLSSGEDIGDAFIDPTAEIEELLSALSGFRKTFQSSDNDSPVTNSFLRIDITLSDGIEIRRLYLYTEGDNAYIEDPYNAIYRGKLADCMPLYEMFNRHAVLSKTTPPSALVRLGLSREEVHSTLGGLPYQANTRTDSENYAFGDNGLSVFYDDSGIVKKINRTFSDGWFGNLRGRVMTVDELRSIVSKLPDLTLKDLQAYKSINISSSIDRYNMSFNTENGVLQVYASSDYTITQMTFKIREAANELNLLDESDRLEDYLNAPYVPINDLPPRLDTQDSAIGSQDTGYIKIDELFAVFSQNHISLSNGESVYVTIEMSNGHYYSAQPGSGRTLYK